MKKKVNIYPRGPITSVNPPIRVPVRNITKDTKDIRKCIIAGAKVEECTPNGPIELNLQNYDLDNGGNYEAIKTGLKMSLIDENEKAIASGLTATNTAPDTSVSPMQHTFEKPEALQAKIQSLELAQAMNGVVRYPNGWTYNAGTSPFCNCGCGCGC